MPPRDYLMDCLVSASAGFLGSGSKFTLYKHLRPEGSPRRDFYRNLRKRYFGSKPAQVHTVDRMDPIEAYRLKPTKPRVKALARKARAAAGLPKPVKPGRARHPKFRPRG